MVVPEPATSFWHAVGPEVLLHALVGLLGPIAILAAAYFAWHKQREIAINRATTDFISARENGNKDLRKAYGLVATMAAKPDRSQGILRLVSPTSDAQRRDQESILNMLNHYELVAVAIKHGSFSAEIYKAYNRTTYVKAWLYTKSFISERRDLRRQDTAYQHFQDLAEEWEQPTDKDLPPQIPEPGPNQGNQKGTATNKPSDVWGSSGVAADDDVPF